MKRAFGSIPRGTKPEQKKALDPTQIGERRVSVKKEAQLPYLAMGYRVPNLQEPDSYVLEVIATLLSGGKSSRLHQSLVREKRLVFSADADHSLLSKDPSLFYLAANPLPGKDVAEIEKALDQEVERLQKELVGERELEKAKNQLEASFIFAQDSLFYQAMLLARMRSLRAGGHSMIIFPPFEKISREDIQRVAKRYLVPDNRTVGVLIASAAQGGKACARWAGGHGTCPKVNDK